MIADWHKKWEQGNFPFFIVQIANYKPVKPKPSQSIWAELREVPFLITQKASNTTLVVPINIGEASNVHPLNKRDVGKRLALAEEGLAYR